MKKVLKWIGMALVVLVVLGLVVINRYGPTVGAQMGMPVYILPPSGERYGEIALEIMDQNGYYASGERWEAEKEEALEKLESIESYEEAYPIIGEALKVAGGKHSFFIPNSNRNTYFSQGSLPTAERKGDFLHLYMPGITDAQAHGVEYAEIVLEALQDNQDVKGIVLDLQDNNGGDMGPMITAISPLLPDGEVLSFAFRQHEQPVTLENGMVSGGGTPIETTVDSFKLNVPVAVLTSGMTGSSGEATLMTLLELDNVKTFGQPTAGYASANASFFLYDNSSLALTVAYNETPNGQMFGDDPIEPDMETEEPLEEALNWLEEVS